MKRAHAKHQGFTIVELLIAIVVIAILATISIVAYNGIGERATAVRYAAVIDTYDKALALYFVDNLTYPEPNLASGVHYACLGSAEGYPAADGFPAGACVVEEATSIVRGTVSPSLNDALGSQISSVPNPPSDIIVSAWGNRYRGIMISLLGPSGYEIEIVLPATLRCPSNMREYANDGHNWCEHAESD